MRLPKPDKVIFLDMPFEMSQILIKNRKNKITGEDKKDIHENDDDHLKLAYRNACMIAKEQKWSSILCVKNGEIKTIEDINDDIYKIVKEMV